MQAAATPRPPDGQPPSVQNGHVGRGPVTSRAFHPTRPPFFLGFPSLQHSRSTTLSRQSLPATQYVPTQLPSTALYWLGHSPFMNNFQPGAGCCNTLPARRKTAVVGTKRASRSRPVNSVRMSPTLFAFAPSMVFRDKSTVSGGVVVTFLGRRSAVAILPHNASSSVLRPPTCRGAPTC